MHKFLKLIKYIFLTFVVTILLIYTTIYLGHKVFFKPAYAEVPTVEAIEEGRFCFGVQCHPKITNAEEYVQLLANQIKIYQEKSSMLWPNNAVVNYYALVESIEQDRSWLIHPDGKIEPMTSAQIME